MRRVTASFLIFCSCAVAQFGRGGGWTTAGFDAQRSFWVRTDPKISKESLEKPGFQYLWKVKLNNQPVQMNSLTSAVTLEGYIGYRGFRTLAHLGGSSNHVFAIDVDLGRLEWEKALPGSMAQSSTPACPGGMTAEVSRPTPAGIAGGVPPRGGGNRGGARSGVGEPGEGAVTITAAAARAGAPGAPPRGPDVPGGRGAAPPRGPGGGRGAPNAVYAISSDGKLHSMLVSNGDETGAPIDFVPANSNAHGLIIVDNAAYVATVDGCGGAANALWAVDLVSKESASWKPANGGIAGSLGAAFNTDGSLYVATTEGDVAHLEAKTLKTLETYSAKPGFASTPVIFAYKSKTLLAVAGKDGSIHLLDVAALGGSDHQTPLAKTPAVANAANSEPALASWQDNDGTRWILASTGSNVTAWKVVEEGSATKLQSGWTSREMVSPLAPMVINGVVFALSSGEYRSTDAKLSAAERIKRSTPAVLYALDSGTGKELWNSAKTIGSFVHGGTLSGGGTQVYLETYDGNFYAFGFYIEH
ncbi:MAG TPA: hypothetical protein VKU19_25555 [Bryobacteraceae bacterium]|nr:hypothetical protein [Bryobacteraceae bacterium]